MAANFEMLPDDLRTHLGDFEKACVVARDHAEVSPPDIDDRAYWQHQIDTIQKARDDIEAWALNNGWRQIATCDVTDDVLVYCEDTEQQFVAYQEREGNIRGLFCYAIHRGAYIMCRPQWWKPLDKGPLS